MSDSISSITGAPSLTSGGSRQYGLPGVEEWGTTWGEAERLGYT